MMNRNEFLRSSVGMAAALLGLSACGKQPSAGGDDDSMIDAATGADAHLPADARVTADAAIDGPPPSCVMNGTSVVIGSNHGHTLTVSKADVTAGVEKIYDITGTSAHPHTVTVTAALFAMLAGNQNVTVTSSTDNMHSHQVMVRCV